MAAFTNTTIIADQADPLMYMGADVDAGFTVATMGDLVGVYTEAYLCNLVKYDIVTNWAALNAIFKLMFSEYACRAIAIAGIQYTSAGYTNGLEESEDMIAIHTNRMEAIEKLLGDSSVRDFLALQ